MNIIATILASIALVVSGWFGVHEVQNNASSLNLGANSTISNLTALTTPDDADTLAIVDNGVSPATTKKITWGNATSTLQTWYDGRYAVLAGGSGIVTVGTITSGTWNGTAIGVGYGGTGTTSPAQYRVLFGNAGSGITIATSTGTTGQFLTSCGANCFPQWTTGNVDQAANYTWAGANLWTASTTHNATTTIDASSVLNKALVLNTVPYQYPSSQCASGQTFVNNGSGILTCQSIRGYSQNSSGPSVTTGSATTTLFTIPAGILGASSTITVDWNGTSLYNGGGGTMYFSAFTSGATTTMASEGCSEGTNGETAQCSGHILISFNSASSQSYCLTGISETQQGIGTVQGGCSTSAINFANAVTLVVWVQAQNASNNMNMTALSVVVTP